MDLLQPPPHGYLLASERLLLRPFNENDADFVLQLLNTEGWLRYVGDRNVHTTHAALQYIARLQQGYQHDNYGLWLVVLAHNKQPIGMCGCLKRPDLAHPDLGFAFMPQQQHMGYATEAARAVVQHMRQQHALGCLLAITVPYNQASIQLLERLGFTHQQDIYMPPDTELLSLYQLDAVMPADVR